MKSVYKLLLVVPCWMFAMQSAKAQSLQNTQGQSFTLQQCIDYALENSIAAQNSILDQKIATARVKETVGLGLPQINGNVSLTSNPILRRFFGQVQTLQGFGGVDTKTQQPLLQIPHANATDVASEQSFFTLKNSGDAGLSVNQLIFNGSYIVGLQAARTFQEVAVKTTNQTKEQIIQLVTKAYYAVLINKERTQLFTSNIGRVDSLLKNTTALNKNGFAESIDVDRIQVTLNNLIVERDKFLNMDELSLALLKFQMNYPQDQPINVLGSIQDMQVADLTDYPKDWDYKIRPDYKVLEANKRLQELNLKNQYASALPVISANASTGIYTQAATFGGLFRNNTTDVSGATLNGVPAQGLGGNNWYNYQTVGVTMNMPIFTGFQRSYRIQQEKLKLNKIENNFKSLKQGIDLEVKQSSISFDNAVKTLTSQKQNMELASKVARVTKIKYEQGIGSNLEVVDAENSLRQSQTNYYGALFDAMVAKVDLDKAYGQLLPMYTTKN